MANTKLRRRAGAAGRDVAQPAKAGLVGPSVRVSQAPRPGAAEPGPRRAGVANQGRLGGYLPSAFTRLRMKETELSPSLLSSFVGRGFPAAARHNVSESPANE